MIGRQRHCIALEEYSREEILEVLDLAVSMKEVLRRPIKKVPSLRGKSIVFVRTATGSFERREVALGAEADGWVQVRAGVKEGDSVVTTGSFLL